MQASRARLSRAQPSKDTPDPQHTEQICHFPPKRDRNQKAPPRHEKDPADLNDLLTRPHWAQKGKVQTYFSTRGIMRKVRQCIRRKDTPYVCGCLASCTDKAVFGDLRAKKGVSLVVSDWIRPFSVARKYYCCTNCKN